MKEEFLHFIWRTRSFTFTGLRTTEAKTVEILDFGVLNTAAGPDFRNGRIRLDGVEWAGHIEIHLVSSDWLKHGHTDDLLYRNVILHVVLEEDVPVYVDGRRLPCLELRGLIDASLLARYGKLTALEPWVPCANLLPGVDQLIVKTWLDRMLIERFERRYEWILECARELQNDWEGVAYRVLGRSFGFHRNGEAFYRLTRVLPLKVIRACSSDPVLVEALIFGCAGYLNRIFMEDYPVRLQREFRHLQNKYKLQAMGEQEWNNGRVRPSNLPVIRLSQFGYLIRESDGLLGIIRSLDSIDTALEWLSCQASSYWEGHTAFDKPAANHIKRMGRTSRISVVINAIAPLQFVYSKHIQDDALRENALEMLAQLPPESNGILNGWHRIGMSNENAGHSQALIHLKDSYCNRGRCTRCAIGAEILLSES